MINEHGPAANPDMGKWEMSVKGKEKNWLETMPDKTWFMGLRMYGATEPWLNKTWRPSEIEEVN